MAPLSPRLWVHAWDSTLCVYSRPCHTALHPRARAAVKVVKVFPTSTTAKTEWEFHRNATENGPPALKAFPVTVSSRLPHGRRAKHLET